MASHLSRNPYVLHVATKGSIRGSMDPSARDGGWGPVQARACRALPYALAALFTAFVGVVTSRHEMWRDEIQAWLIARDSTGPWALLHNLKYEGHPGLWHLLLWPFARLSPNPVWMQILHVAIAGASALLLFRFAPFPWVVKIPLMLGYYFVYEWAVIARNYGVSVLILFAFCALYAQRWRRFPMLGVLLFLLCHTNVYGVLIAGALLLRSRSSSPFPLPASTATPSGAWAGSWREPLSRSLGL